jgi:hypothetical protein
VIHYESAPARGVAYLFLARRRYYAITFGHVVISVGTMTEHNWRHELAHVAQYDRLGLAFIPLYLWHYARRGYARHPLELQAEAIARANAGAKATPYTPSS